MDTSIYDQLPCADELRRLDALYARKKAEVTQALAAGSSNVWRLVSEESQLRQQLLEIERQEAEKIPHRVALMESQLHPQTHEGAAGHLQAHITAEDEATYGRGPQS